LEAQRSVTRRPIRNTNPNRKMDTLKWFFLVAQSIRYTVYSVFIKIFFCSFNRFLKKLCFEPKKVDEKSSNGHWYFSILERSCNVEFEKNVTKKVLGQKMNRVTSCSFFSAMFKSKKNLMR
jgi:hypothetical protein